MSVRLLLTTTVVAAGVLAPAATAGAAKKAPKYPTVTSISPMRVEIGGTMTITGKNFVKGRAKNTVVFRRSGKKVVFAKADGLTTKKLRLKVPAKLRTSLGKQQGAFVATKFQIRVLARRFGKTYTALKRSPVIVPDSVDPAAPTPAEAKKAAEAAAAAAAAGAAAAGTPAPPSDCDRDGTPDASDADDDNDLLADTVETSIGTLTCVADTDGDGMTDGWEYQSALDLNQESCPSADHPTPCAAVVPYPGKRPYPNPRDGADGGTDHDGDWLTSSMEFTAYSRKAATSAPHRTLTNMWYSDGKQASQDTSPVVGCRGMTVPTHTAGNRDVRTAAYRVYSTDRFGTSAYDGCLNDAERDEDADFLSNHVEATGALSNNKWWEGNYANEKTYWWVAYSGTDWLDTDTDGDGKVDGVDDQDHDDFWNMEELVRGPQAVDKNGDPITTNQLDANGVEVAGPVTGPQHYGLWVQPFNPCLPAIRSRTCPPTIPLSGSVWAPFAKPDDDELKPRWPLFGVGDDNANIIGVQEYDDVWGELWASPGFATQTLPPAQPGTGGGALEHPLPRIY
jgi:hypothetical protein